MIGETYTLKRGEARAYFAKFPKAAYMTEIESWRELPGGGIEYTIRRRYRVWKLRALCSVLRRLRVGEDKRASGKLLELWFHGLSNSRNPYFTIYFRRQR